MDLSDCPLTTGEPDVKRADHGGRVLDDSALDRMIRRAMPRVPVTRVSEVSRLDHGSMPVFSATTPLARDLTTHMGKGRTPRAAELSAIMEALERVSAERPRRGVRQASHAQLLDAGETCLDPAACDLPPSSNYGPDRVYDWLEGWDLMGGRPVWVPVDLCVSPPLQGLLDQVDTNGLASGGTLAEAIRHALLEVIERDAISQHLYFDHYGTEDHAGPERRAVASEHFPECLPGAGRFELCVHDISTDLDVPVMACHAIDDRYPTEAGPTRMVFGGWGCDPVPGNAILRAVSEAHQSRVGTLQGTRDSFNILTGAARDFTARRQAEALANGQGAAQRLKPAHHGCLSEDIGWLLERLRRVGVDMVAVVDMSDPELGVPVVRVRVPGLSVYVVDRHRIGWRAMRHVL